MIALKQVAAILGMSLRNLPQQFAACAVTVVGIASTVGVLVAMLSMGAGTRQLVAQTARADRAIVLSHGAEGDATSSLSRETVHTLSDMSGVRKDSAGKPLAAADASTLIWGRRQVDNADVVVYMTGVTSQYRAVHPELQLLAGRWFRPGLREVVVGKSRATQIKGYTVGGIVRLHGRDWPIVGEFTTGSGLDSSLLTDAETLMTDGKSNFYNELTLLLDSPQAFAGLEAAIRANPALHVDLEHEAEVMNLETRELTGLLDFVSYFVGVVMAIGATLGAVNALYAVVDRRKREIATLRAIGFRNVAVVLAVLIEALILALPAALVGTGVAWWLFDGNSISPVGITFKLRVTPELAGVAILWALTMGMLGGLWPAIRAARTPVVAGLRAD